MKGKYNSLIYSLKIIRWIYKQVFSLKFFTIQRIWNSILFNIYINGNPKTERKVKSSVTCELVTVEICWIGYHSVGLIVG